MFVISIFGVLIESLIPINIDSKATNIDIIFSCLDDSF